MTLPRSLRSLLTAGAAAGLLAGAAGAHELFVGSTNTLVEKTDPILDTTSLVGACGGSVHSLVTIGGEAFAGTVQGEIYTYPGAGFLSFWLQAPNDALSLASDGLDLVVGGSDGSIIVYDYTSKTVRNTFQNVFDFPVNAMTFHDGVFYTSSDFGVTAAGSIQTGVLTALPACGDNVSAIAGFGDTLYLATDSGSVWTLDLVSLQFTGLFQIGAPATGMVVYEGDLLVGSVDGTVRRHDRFTGALKQTRTMNSTVDALALHLETEPGFQYCFGSVCPCGNLDGENACVNSAGFGAGFSVSGTASHAADDLVMTATDLPKNTFSRFYMGPEQIGIPFGDGLLCAGNGLYPTFRFPVVSTGASGITTLGPGTIDYVENNLQAGMMLPGTTWNFQAWFRDPSGPCGNTVNTSVGYAITLLP